MLCRACSAARIGANELQDIIIYFLGSKKLKGSHENVRGAGGSSEASRVRTRRVSSCMCDRNACKVLSFFIIFLSGSALRIEVR